MTAVALRAADPVPESWAFDTRDLAGLRCAPALRLRAAQTERMVSVLAPRPSGGCAGRVLSKARTLQAPVPLVGAAGLGLMGAALLGAAPAQAAAIEFPSWVTVTGTVPDDAGLDRAAAEANDWTFSWSTDADGVVAFAYADGSRSTSLDPTARHAAPPTAEDLSSGDRLAVQSLRGPLWEADPAQPAADPGLDDLAAAAAAPLTASPVAVAGPFSSLLLKQEKISIVREMFHIIRNTFSTCSPTCTSKPRDVPPLQCTVPVCVGAPHVPQLAPFWD